MPDPDPEPIRDPVESFDVAAADAYVLVDYGQRTDEQWLAWHDSERIRRGLLCLDGERAARVRERADGQAVVAELEYLFERAAAAQRPAILRAMILWDPGHANAEEEACEICDCVIAWRGKLTERPACPWCGHSVPPQMQRQQLADRTAATEA